MENENNNATQMQNWILSYYPGRVELRKFHKAFEIINSDERELLLRKMKLLGYINIISDENEIGSITEKVDMIIVKKSIF